MITIANFREYLRIGRVRRALRILMRDGQPELEKVLREKAAEMAIPLSIRGVHQIMEQRGLTHCYACPQRFSLRKIREGMYACAPCFKRFQETEARVNSEQAKAVANA